MKVLIITKAEDTMSRFNFAGPTAVAIPPNPPKSQLPLHYLPCCDGAGHGDQ